jgi:hypothetical protein
MKKIYLVFFLFISFFTSNSQTVSVLYNLNTTDSTVIGNKRYHVSESIYTNEELGAGNFTTSGSAIQSIGYFLYIIGNNTTVSSFKIWMKNIPATTTTLTNGTYSTASYTNVYNGSFSATPTGYIYFTLSTPFVRTPGTNLQILIERLDNLAHPGYFFIESEGNIINPNLNTTRYYNGNVAPSGSTTLTAKISRPAIRLVHTYPLDAGIVDISNPTVSCYGSPQSLDVQVFNAGTDVIPAGAATVNLKISGPNSFSGSQTNTTAIASGATATVTFSNINLNNAGDNIDTAYVTLAGDGTTYNDTLVSVTTTASTLSTYPIIEDAEDSLPVFPFAELVIGTTQLWTIQIGDYTNFDQTIPLTPRTPGNYFYLFDSYSGSSSVGFISRLYSNCITLPTPLPSTPAPVTTVSFWMSHDNLYATSLDSLYLTVSTDKGLTWARLLPGFQRADAAATTPYWKQEIIDISAYNGQTIQLGFEGVSDYGNIIGLDDITINYSGLAPVSLLSFDASRNGKVNNLQWSTSLEINTNKFVIERSADGKNFTSLGEVRASGNSTVNQYYRFTDAAPIKAVNYYRIRMIDNDNTYKFSEIKSVKNSGMVEMTINPNPVSQLMRISLQADANEIATIIVSDLTGKRIISKSMSVVAGLNNLEIPVSQLSSGTYIVTIRLNSQTLVKKISKL